jgi:DAK2 domain fusion protein YloV
MNLDGIMFRNMCKGGLDAILAVEKKVNSLNVFPVPDGDTGTNMKLTLEHGVNDSYDTKSIGEFSLKLARGMLLGARGNSGVILSQLFKGLSRHLKNFETISAIDYKDALILGYETAYQAVIHPTEGTILTVARLGIENIKDKITNSTSFEELFALYIASMKDILKETPEMLPVLKEAGVIDSGGAGLIAIYEGMEAIILGKEVPHILSVDDKKKEEEILFNEDSVLEYGYCTEFILQLQNSKCDIKNFNLDLFIKFLEAHGDSIVALKDESIVKVHVHTMAPGDILNEAQKYGEFITFKMENMSIQHNEVIKEKKEKLPHKHIAYIAVAQGEGFKNLYKDYGCDIILDGGKTFNTSAEEFLNAMDMIDADEIIILPNNKNVHLAAEQARNIKDKDHIHVLHTNSLVEGYFAFSMMDTVEEDIDVHQQIENMISGIESVHSFGVTMAVKDSSYNGISIARGDYISVLDGDIVYTSKDKKEAVTLGLRKISDIDEKEIIILFKGKNLLEEEKDGIIEALEEEYPNATVGEIDGDQDTYGVLIGIS